MIIQKKLSQNAVQFIIYANYLYQFSLFLSLFNGQVDDRKCSHYMLQIWNVEKKVKLFIHICLLRDISFILA